MLLRILEGGSTQTVDAYRPSQFDLGVHPVRPGVAHDGLTLALDSALASGVERAAAGEGLPTPLWAALVIESERALHTLARDTATDTRILERALEDSALCAFDVLPALRGRRLVRYALALCDLRPRATRTPQRQLTLAVPHHTLVAWELAATAEQQALTQWAEGHLRRLPSDRARWESAAAKAGQTIGEWIAVQAARRSSD